MAPAGYDHAEVLLGADEDDGVDDVDGGGDDDVVVEV